MKWHSMPSSAPTARNLTLNVIRTSGTVTREQVMFVETEYLSTTARGSNGYGSTGR